MCWSSNPKAQVLLLEGDAIAWGGKAEIQGEGLVRGNSQLHLHQEDSVVVGEDLVYSLILTPFINSVSCLLCQPPF